MLRIGPLAARLPVWLLVLMLASQSAAADLRLACEHIFTTPPRGQVPMAPPPGIFDQQLGDLNCTKQGCTGRPSNSFSPGDYPFNSGNFDNGAELQASGVTVRSIFAT
ncbi:hypothetical protein ACTG15_13725 [Aeromonas sp. 164P]